MKNFAVGFVFLFSFFAFGCQNPSSETPKTPTPEPVSAEISDTIKIGGIAALSGDAAEYGVLTQNVANLRLEEINTAGGINGKKLEIIWEDGKCAPGDASRAAQKLIGVDNVKIIFGGTCSGETLGAAPITEGKNVILFSPMSSSPEITNAGNFVFRTAPSDSSQGKVLGEFAQKNYKKIGILSEQTDYALGVKNTFKKYFTGEMVDEDYLSTESDFKTRITKLKNENLDALFINTQSPPKYEIVLKQLAEQNWDKDILINEFGAGSPEIAVKFKDFLAGKRVVSANFVAPESPKLAELVQKYEQKFGTKPGYQNYAASTVDGLNILAEVIRKVGADDTAKIRDELYATQNFSGIYPNLSFDENGDVNITHSLFEFDGEKFNLISGDEPAEKTASETEN